MDLIELLLVVSLGVAAAIVVVMSGRLGRFCYGVSLGLPDLAVSVGGIVHARLDDALVGLLLFRILLFREGLPLGLWTRRAVGSLAIFFGFCMVSALVAYAGLGTYGAYQLYRAIGGFVAFAVIVVVASRGSGFRELGAGLLVGGLLLMLQASFNLATGAEALTDEHFQNLKTAASFGTWNPNTIGMAGLFFSFALGLAGFCDPWSMSRWLRVTFFGGAFLAALMPPMFFVRGASISVAMGWLLFFLFTRRWKVLAGVLAVVAAAGSAWAAWEYPLFQEAIAIDISTGAGFSNRYDLWFVGKTLFLERLFLGHGFGHESLIFESRYGSGMSHNAFLSILVELGLLGLGIFLFFFLRVLRRAVLMAGRERSDLHSLALCFLVALTIASMSGSGLYWEKPSVLSLAVIAAVLNISPRGGSEGRPKQGWRSPDPFSW